MQSATFRGSCTEPKLSRVYTAGQNVVGVDETDLKVRGEWGYLYRAVDRAGTTVKFRLSPKRDMGAAKPFVREVIRDLGSVADRHAG